ncbi:hypothetical protein DACRYDRAFT_107428 [Dacryopinax primogenitus]|uniref:Uncharacterized protein n=1 Tax=Dacryopinax primogenitus (strain DJM 731) TaxID=1858805 RepID=M5G0P2_DACPD|nr:uncharacterized protein DACRYDRAFT_107428 [Dacryopinax primogenitus]EJU01680.1 hypothetical protein DACRYDRAFT_107428 [Dacryopinax primogenitus]
MTAGFAGGTRLGGKTWQGGEVALVVVRPQLAVIVQWVGFGGGERVWGEDLARGEIVPVVARPRTIAANTLPGNKDMLDKWGDALGVVFDFTEEDLSYRPDPSMLVMASQTATTVTGPAPPLQTAITLTQPVPPQPEQLTSHVAPQPEESTTLVDSGVAVLIDTREQIRKEYAERCAVKLPAKLRECPLKNPPAVSTDDGYLGPHIDALCTRTACLPAYRFDEKDEDPCHVLERLESLGRIYGQFIRMREEGVELLNEPRLRIPWDWLLSIIPFYPGPRWYPQIQYTCEITMAGPINPNTKRIIELEQKGTTYSLRSARNDGTLLLQVSKTTQDAITVIKRFNHVGVRQFHWEVTSQPNRTTLIVLPVEFKTRNLHLNAIQTCYGLVVGQSVLAAFDIRNQVLFGIAACGPAHAHILGAKWGGESLYITLCATLSLHMAEDFWTLYCFLFRTEQSARTTLNTAVENKVRSYSQGQSFRIWKDPGEGQTQPDISRKRKANDSVSSSASRPTKRLNTANAVLSAPATSVAISAAATLPSQSSASNQYSPMISSPSSGSLYLNQLQLFNIDELKLFHSPVNAHNLGTYDPNPCLFGMALEPVHDTAIECNSTNSDDSLEDSRSKIESWLHVHQDTAPPPLEEYARSPYECAKSPHNGNHFYT